MALMRWKGLDPSVPLCERFEHPWKNLIAEVCVASLHQLLMRRERPQVASRAGRRLQSFGHLEATTPEFCCASDGTHGWFVKRIGERCAGKAN